MNKIEYFIKNNSSAILACVASSGVIITTILAIKATPKAVKKLEKAKENKGDNLTLLETIYYGYEPYVYTIMSATATIICIAGIEYLNHKKQASLISAYTLLENSYSNYRDNIKCICPEETDTLAKQDIIKAKYDDSYELNDDEELFFDYQSMRFFTSTFDNVIRAEHDILEVLKYRGYACMNEYYDYLGIPMIDWGYQLGWSNINTEIPYNKNMEFNYEETTVGDGIKCWIITTSIPATFDYVI